MSGTIIFGCNSAANREHGLDLATQLLGNPGHIRNNSHPDFLQISTGADPILIDDARRINEFASLKPIANKNKVILIENIENLSPNAANAILKTLEGPEENTAFLLTTTKLTAVLPTIRSRCVKLKVNILNNFDDFDYNFMKKYEENYPDFIKACLIFCYKQLRNNYNYAVKISKLQALFNMTATTYPNKDYVISLAKRIAKLA